MLFNLLLLFSPGATDIPSSIYDFKVASINGGNEIDLSAYKGKKILIVNVPSQLVTDRQYAELNELQKKYQDKLVVIGFLADEFGIAPGSKQRHADYRTDYNVSFPMTSKTQIRGANMSPVFKWLTSKQYNKLKDSEVKWNFQKYLINEQGELVAVFDPKVRPANAAIIAEIEK